jgi:hypothetical protein
MTTSIVECNRQSGGPGTGQDTERISGERIPRHKQTYAREQQHTTAQKKKNNKTKEETNNNNQ